MLQRSTAFVCLVLMLSTVANAQAFKPGTDPMQTLRPYLMISPSNDRLSSIEAVMNDTTAAFVPLTSLKKIDPYKTWWMKLEIDPSYSSNDFFIGLPRSEISGLSHGNDEAEVWIVENNKIIQHYNTGNLVPVTKRPISGPINRNFFPLRLKAQQPVFIYWRIARTINFQPLQLNFALQHRWIIESAPSSIDRLAWFYTGVMAILFVFGLVFLIITRDQTFKWFMFIAATLCLHMQLLNPENFLTRWLFPGHPSFQYHLFAILTSGFMIFVLQLTRSFANTKRLLPVWDKILLIIMFVTAIILVVSLIILQTNPSKGLPETIYTLPFLVTAATGVRLMFTNDLYARWSGLALLWLFIFQVLGILWNEGVLGPLFPNPWATGQLGMMAILFFGLAYRFKQSAKEKADALKVLEMDALRSRFFANISHEFRTPLTLMLGPLKHLQENSLDEVRRKNYIAMMQRNGDRLLQLINQLLDLSKLESGKMELRATRTDITALLKSISSSFESLAEEKQVNYRAHFPEDNLEGYIDRDKIEKIVGNILSNAFRFTNNNGSVSLAVEQEENRLRIIIQDNGTGIPKDQLDKIFDRFHQVKGTEGGTGIGLALVKELLQLHKGQVSIQSEYGSGTTFRISVPINSEAYSAAEKTDHPFVQIAQAMDHSSPENNYEIEEADAGLPLILVVEDNPDLQQLLSDTFRAHYRVHVAANGLLGLEQATTIIPDCIVSDIMMPEMDGITLCQKIKSGAATSHIPVVLLTAKAGKDSRISGLQTGADDYVVKPFDSDELIARVGNLIEQRKQLREKYSREVVNIQPEEMMSTGTEHDFIVSVRAAIEAKLDDELFGVNELADTVHLSRSQLHRKLKSLTGQSPNEIIRNYRLEKAMQLLQQTSANIGEIAFQTGFSSAAYFSKCFSDRYGKTPMAVRR